MKIGDTIETIGALYRGLRRDPAGTTISVRARQPLDSIDGYVVGGFGRTFVAFANEDALSEDIFSDAEGWTQLTRWLRELPDNTSHVGAWLAEGMYYFDVVQIFTNRHVALKVAEANGEMAIWDGIKQVEIPVQEPERG